MRSWVEAFSGEDGAWWLVEAFGQWGRGAQWRGFSGGVVCGLEGRRSVERGGRSMD